MKYNANFEIETEHLNKTIKQFKEVAYAQEVKGINKYGKSLDPLDDYDWLDMEFEEIVDAAKYNRAMKSRLNIEKEERRLAISKIRKLTNDVEINFWLDELEGEK